MSQPSSLVVGVDGGVTSNNNNNSLCLKLDDEEDEEDVFELKLSNDEEEEEEEEEEDKIKNLEKELENLKTKNEQEIRKEIFLKSSTNLIKKSSLMKKKSISNQIKTKYKNIQLNSYLTLSQTTTTMATTNKRHSSTSGEKIKIIK